MGSVRRNTLFQSVRELIENSRGQVVRNVNTIMIYTNFNIGKMIVEEEQKGSTRAGYADTVLKDLSRALSVGYGKGFSHRNLDYFKKFYLLYRERISQTASAKSPEQANRHVKQTLLDVFAEQFKVSWSHYVLLMKVQAINERDYYESRRRHVTGL